MPVSLRGVTAGRRQGRIRWSPEKPDKRFDFRKKLATRFDEIVVLRAQQVAREMRAYAQEHAPWTDQPEQRRKGYTGPHARDGLFSGVERQKSGLVIALTHSPRVISPRGSFPYGIALENFNYRWGRMETDGEGTYAIINPTLERFAPLLMDALDGAFAEAARARSREMG